MRDPKGKFFSRLIESTTGAVREIVTKHAMEGRIPVGFSLVFYHPEPANPEDHWHCVPYTIIDPHSPSPQDKKTREKVDMILQFLSEGIKRILEGNIEDEKAATKDVKNVFQVPGIKGRA